VHWRATHCDIQAYARGSLPSNPPVIVVHGNSLEHVTDTYKRFLEGRFRKAFNLSGTPLRIEMKTSTNPFAGKEAS
jgi:GTP-binding protein